MVRAMSEFESPGELLLGILQSSQRGLSEREVQRQSGLPRQSVAAALRVLQKAGHITRADGRWSAIRLDLPPRAEPIALQPVPEGLDILRRICAFYSDVLHEIQSNNLVLEPNDEQLAAVVRAPVDWFRLARGSFSVPRADLPPGAVSHKGGRTTFCGPLHLLRRRKHGVEKLVWLPVFLLHTKPRREPDHIEFQIDGDIQLNMEWLEAHYSGEDEELRDDLLIRLGMLREDAKSSLQPISVRNLEDCWEALQNRVQEFEWITRRGLRTPDLALPLRKQRELGIHASVLAFQEELPPFTKRLIQELREIAKSTDEELSRSALMVLLAPSEVSATPTPDRGPHVLAEASTLNPSQCEAVVQALAAPLTVVQGPPGTGKSTVVRSALLSLGVNGQTAIFGSMNHRAVNAVVEPMNREMPEGFLVADLRPSDRESRWTSQLQSNLSGARRRSDLDLGQLRDALGTAERGIAGILAETRATLEDGDLLVEIERILSRLSEDNGRWEEDVHQLSLAVSLEELESVLESISIERTLLRRILATLKRWRLLRLMRASWPSQPGPGRTLLPVMLEWKARLLQSEAVEARLKGRRSLDTQGEDLVDRVERKADLMEETLQDLPAIWADRVRGEVSALADIRREEHGGGIAAKERREEVECRYLTKLLPGLPLWTITSLSAPRAVPRVAGAFDLAIIDEAGQCHPASAIPLLFRSKRAMFVGDPQQLRPVGSLASHKEELFRRRHGLDGTAFSRFSFSGRSAYDLARDALVVRSGRVRLLREHYRCHPAIAEFFNEHFYDSSLQIRTSGRDEGTGPAGISWTHVPGGSQTVGSSRWHPPQVQAIVDELCGLSDRSFDGSVGIVTPFREHAKRIRDAAYSRVGTRQLEKWDFLAETADGFQGGERDLILFGLVGGGEGKSATPPFYLRERNRFNVAVSRARVLLHVFGDETWARHCGIPVLSSLLEAARPQRARGSDSVRTDLIGPVWEPRLAMALRQEGIEARQQYPACGYYLDFAIFLPDGAKIDLEVDGETYHRDRDGNLRAEDIRRDLVLRSNGWTVKRFWVYQLREDWNSCLLQIKQLIIPR